MSFSVTILGSNSALPTSERYPTAQMLNVSERFFLIDCGEGTQMQLRKYKVKFSRINHIFISHLHGDHIFGLMGLISTLGLLGRKNDLHIFAHPDLEKLLQPQIDYYCADLPYKVVFKPIDPRHQQVIFEDDKVTVETIPLKHRIPACGYLFRQKPAPLKVRKACIDQFELSIAEIVKIKNGCDLRLEDGTIIPNCELTEPSIPGYSYAFCSDTRYFEKLSTMVKDVDLLYHESTFTNADEQLARKTTHSTAEQAALTAKNANAKQLIIGHFSARHRDLSPYLEEAKNVFPNTQLALEGITFDVTKTQTK
jgi:ribonuclease Z